MKFTDKVALITGAGSERGFGRTMALMFAERGCNLVIADMDGDGAKKTAELAQAKNVRAIGLKVDVASEADVKNMVATCMSEFGKVDILVNNAGITQSRPTVEMSLDEWNKILAVDLTGVFLCCREVLPHMIAREYGRIINVASISGQNGGGVFGGAHYCAAKAGVIGYSKALGKEMAKKGITVNAVSPGASKTDVGGRKFEDKAVPVDIPMGRRGETYEIASAAVYLASDHASYLTGSTISVNGGAYMA